MGGCEPQFEKKQGSWNDLPITVGGIPKLHTKKMCLQKKVIFWRDFPLGNFGA